ncbi:hypothetical protein FB446DRAFT_200781 [Lentinula raphanica]|nr:hypothetical protein FB446DRAFT_200781 [Lentinula raphanica]
MRFITFLWPSVLLFSMMAHALPVGGEAPPPYHEVVSTINMRKPPNAIEVTKSPLYAGKLLSELQQVPEITFTLLPPSAHAPSRPEFEALLHQTIYTKHYYFDWARHFAERVFEPLHVTASLSDSQADRDASLWLLSPPYYWKFKITTPNVLVVNHGDFPQVKHVDGQDRDHGSSWHIVSTSGLPPVLGLRPLSRRVEHVAAIIPDPCEVGFSLGRVDGRLEFVAHFQHHAHGRSSTSDTTNFEAVFKPQHLPNHQEGEPEVKLSGSFFEATLNLNSMLNEQDKYMLALFV